MSQKKLGRVRSLLRQLLHLGDSPDRTAGAFALGVFLAFSPFIGLHTVLGLAFAFLLRLNRVAVLIGVWTNTPWTLAPAISLGTAIGFVTLGTETKLSINWDSILSADFWRHMWSDVENLLLPFFVGNLILSAVIALLAFVVARRILRRHRGTGEKPPTPEPAE
jgi:uncharacterized protein (DUF2062 family)